MHADAFNVLEIFNNFISVQQSYIDRFSKYQNMQINKAFDFSYQYLDFSLETLKSVHLKIIEDRSASRLIVTEPLIQAIIDSSSHLRLRVANYQKGFTTYKETMSRFLKPSIEIQSLKNEKTPLSVNHAMA